MQTTEVTLDQWRALMGKRIFGKRKGPGNMPVIEVSWHDCMDFIKKLNSRSEWSYRLPTEAEWEYACRAASSTAYSWGNTIDCEKAMYGNNSRKCSECIDYVQSRGLFIDRPAPVKSYHANAWGLYDMHGNVWEWCHDWYADYTLHSKTDPQGPDSGTMRIRRGGSWFKYGYSCRSANRNSGHPSSRYQTTGFRLIGVRPVDYIDTQRGP
jgi:formylglycine-generating enzyme required for sulfatase activity